MEYVSGVTPDDRLETSFTRMVDATSEDYAIIARHALGFTQGLPDRILRHLALPVTRAGMRSTGSPTACRPPPARTATGATRSTWCARWCTTSETRSPA